MDRKYILTNTPVGPVLKIIMNRINCMYTSTRLVVSCDAHINLQPVQTCAKKTMLTDSMDPLYLV